jgi:hypothetical protein
MLDAVNTPLKIILFYLGISLIPQFLYFEISFLIRNRDNRPKLRESFMVGFIIGVALVVFWLNYGGGGGESGLVFIGISPIFISFFIITGLPIGLIYKKRNKSLFKC